MLYDTDRYFTVLYPWLKIYEAQVLFWLRFRFFFFERKKQCSRFHRSQTDPTRTLVFVTVQIFIKNLKSTSMMRINPLKPNDPSRHRTAPLTSKRCILYIYSTNIGTEYFLSVSSSSKSSSFHNSNVFGSCIIHILYTECAKIKKKFRRQKVKRRLKAIYFLYGNFIKFRCIF